MFYGRLVSFCFNKNTNGLPVRLVKDRAAARRKQYII